MGKFNLSGAEAEIMKLLWETDKRLTFREIYDYFTIEKEKNWQRQSLRTQLIRLSDKGFIGSEKDGEYIVYWPLKSEKENVQSWTKGLLNDLFQGSIKNLLIGLSGGNKLTQEDIEELREFIEEDLKEK